MKQKKLTAFSSLVIVACVAAGLLTGLTRNHDIAALLERALVALISAGMLAMVLFLSKWIIADPKRLRMAPSSMPFLFILLLSVSAGRLLCWALFEP